MAEKTYIFVDDWGYWAGLFTEEERQTSANRNMHGWQESIATDEQIAEHNREVAKKFING